MRFFTRIAVLFYMMTISTIGILTIILAFIIDRSLIQTINYYMNVFYYDTQVRIIVGLSGLLFILLSIMCARIISGAQQKERTIAFDNPAGRVTISLIALEDMVKRLLTREPEVKEGRPDIIATKKGIEIETRLILKSDVNIPDLTAKLQSLIKDKIQDMIGLEETVTVRIHVIKIITEENKGKRNKGDYSDKTETNVPFQGYRA